MKVREILAEAIRSALTLGYHRTRNVDTTKAIGETGFKVGGRALYGNGIYLTYDFGDQQDDRMKRLYGPFIVRAKVNLTGMLIFDPVAAYNVYGIKCSNGTGFSPVALLRPQFERFGLPVSFLDGLPATMDLTETTSVIALRFFKKLGRQTKGLVFTGAKDGRVIVAYDASAVVPFAWARVIDLTRTAATVNWNKFAVLRLNTPPQPLKMFPMAVSFFKRQGFNEVAGSQQHFTDGGDLIGKFGTDTIIIKLLYSPIYSTPHWTMAETTTRSLRIEAFVSRQPDAAVKENDIANFADRLYANMVQMDDLRTLPKVLSAAAKSIFKLHATMAERAATREDFAKELLAKLLDDAAFDPRQLRLDLPAATSIIYGSDYRRDRIQLQSGPVTVEIRSPYDVFTHGDVTIKVGTWSLALRFNDASRQGKDFPSINMAYRMLLDDAASNVSTLRQLLKTQELPATLSEKFRDDLMHVVEKNAR